MPEIFPKEIEEILVLAPLFQEAIQSQKKETCARLTSFPLFAICRPRHKHMDDIDVKSSLPGRSALKEFVEKDWKINHISD